MTGTLYIPFGGLFTFAFGALWGSFLNVVIHRLPEGGSVAEPKRSFCPSCKTGIAWYDNIPVLSWLFLRGRCRHCKAEISLRYPIVELLGGILVMAVYRQFGISAPGLIYTVFALALLALTFIDLDHWWLPDVITLPGIALGLAVSFINPVVSPKDAAIGAAAAYGVFWLLGTVWSHIRKVDALGLGDAKLLAMIAAFLGWGALPFVVFAASVQGLLAWLVLLPLGGLAEQEAEAAPAEDEAPAEDADAEADDEDDFVPTLYHIPFGPFLALGALEQLFVGDRVVAWYLDTVFRLLY